MGAGSLTIHTAVDAGLATVLASGDVDVHTGVDLRDEVERLVSTGVDRVLIDASMVRFVDSSGLGALISARKAATLAGIPFEVLASDRLRQLLQRTGLAGWFGVG